MILSTSNSRIQQVLQLTCFGKGLYLGFAEVATPFQIRRVCRQVLHEEGKVQERRGHKGSNQWWRHLRGCERYSQRHFGGGTLIIEGLSALPRN